MGRFSGKEDFHDTTPIWFYVPVTLIGLLPWTAFIGAAFSTFHRRDEELKQRHAQWFLWIWALFIIVFFSKSSTKLFSYILPAMPALALLLAHGILRGVDKTKVAVPAIVAVTNIVGAIAVMVFLTDNGTIDRHAAMPYAIVSATVLLVAGAMTLKAWTTGDAWRVLVTQFIGAVALYACILALASKVAMYEDSSTMLRALQPYLRPGEKIIETSSFQPTAIFYLRRPLQFINFTNTSGLDEKALAASPLFIELSPSAKLTEDPKKPVWDLTPLLKTKQRTFVLLRWRRKDYYVPPGTFTWARNNDFKIVCNQAPPADFHYDFTAPKKAALENEANSSPASKP